MHVNIFPRYILKLLVVTKMLGRLKQEDAAFGATVCYVIGSRAVQAT